MAQNEERKGNEKEQRIYGKELTIEVNIQGEDRVTMMDVLRKVKEECGRVIACRVKTPKKYELTMHEPKGKEKLMDGLKIGNNIIVAKELNVTEVVVSFMTLPAYITDEEILDKLAIWGVSAVSAIKRRLWPGTDIAEGTRFVKVRFPKNVSSLPYSTKFETLQGVEYFRVIHDRQTKVCRLCIQPGHIMSDCPDFVCFRCGKQGHYARGCEKARGESQELVSEPEDGGEEEDTAAEGDNRGEAAPAAGEEVEKTSPAEREEEPPAEIEDEQPAEREGVEGTASAEGQETAEGGPQHAAQGDGPAADIGCSMDDVIEEIESSVEGKCERAGGAGPSEGPAPPPGDHGSTALGRSRLPRIGRGHAGSRPGSGVRTRGGLFSGPEPQLAAPETYEEVSDSAEEEEMDLSPEGISSLKRKAKEERRIKAKK